MSSLCLETNMLLSKFRDFSSENAATNVENRNRFSQILNEDASPDFLHLASSVGRSGAFNRVVHSPLHQNRLVSSISPIESDLHLRISKASFEDAEAVVRVNPIMRLNVADRVIFATQYKEMSSASSSDIEAQRLRLQVASKERLLLTHFQKFAELVDLLQESIERDAVSMGELGYDAVDREVITGYIEKYKSLQRRALESVDLVDDIIDSIGEQYTSLLSDSCTVNLEEFNLAETRVKSTLAKMIDHLSFYIEAFSILEENGFLGGGGYLYINAKTFQMMSFLLEDIPIEFDGDIGHGGNARVLLAKQGSFEYAAKVPLLPDLDSEIDKFKREVAISLLFCPRAHVITPILVNMGDTPLCFMDLAKSDLYSLVRDHDGIVNIEKLLRACRDILEGLEDIDSRGVVHEDIKPGNVLLLKNGKAVVSDLGLARPQGSTKGLGTPGFIAPEIMQDVPKDGKADIFSLGASVYHLLTGSTLTFDLAINKVFRSKGIECVQDLVKSLKKDPRSRSIFQMQYLKSYYTDERLRAYLRNFAAKPLKRLGGQKTPGFLVHFFWSTLRTNPNDRSSAEMLRGFFFKREREEKAAAECQSAASCLDGTTYPDASEKK